MNDDDLDRLLTEAGSEWRDGHERVADVDVRHIARRAAWTTTSRWVPLAAAAAVLGVLAVVLVIRPTSGNKDHATGTPVASPSPTSSDSFLPASTFPLTAPNTSVDFLRAGSMILVENDYHPGARAALEVRSVEHPDVATFRTRSSWLKGGDLSCATLSDNWLVYTDVQDEPSMLSPGPPQGWRLVARNLATGEQRLLDAGTADMSQELGCAVREGKQVAWTSGRTTQITLYDIGTRSRSRLSVAGVPVAFTSGGLLVSRGAMGPRSAVVLVDPATGSSRTIASVNGSYVESANGYLGWLDPAGKDDWTSTILHLCRLPDCRGADSARTAIDNDPNGQPQITVGDGYLAWADGGTSVTVSRAAGGKGTLTVEGQVDSLAADGSQLVFVEKRNAGTPRENDFLHLVQVPASR